MRENGGKGLSQLTLFSSNTDIILVYVQHKNNTVLTHAAFNTSLSKSLKKMIIAIEIKKKSATLLL